MSAAAEPARADPRWTGVLLVGGQALRMGCDKLALRLPDGLTLAERAAGSLAACCSRLLAAHRPDRPPPALPGFQPVPDVAPGGGPLAGLLAALETADTPWLLLAGADMPELRAEFLRAFMALAEQDPHRALALGRGRHLEPLPLAVPLGLAAEVRGRFEQGERALRRAVPASRLRVADPGELRLAPQQRPWLSLNTPEDWRSYTGEELAQPACA